MEKAESDGEKNAGARRKIIHDGNNLVQDTLALTLITSMMTLENIDVGKSIRRERDRIVKEKSTLAILLNQLMLELEDEVKRKLFEHVQEAETKIEEIKEEIDRCEVKIRSLEDYADKLGRALKLLGENPEESREKDQDEEKLRKDAERTNTVSSTPSPMSSSSSTTSSTSSVYDRRHRFKDWRKLADMQQDISAWKIITPTILKARQQVDLLTNQLSFEFCKQMNSSRTPTRAVLRKIKTLEQEIEECEEEIKAEEERAVNIYKSAIISKDTRIRLRMCPKGK